MVMSSGGMDRPAPADRDSFHASLSENVLNGLISNTEFSSYATQRQAACPQCNGLIPSVFVLSPRKISPTLPATVVIVVGISAEKEMVRPNTSAVVAAMTDQHAARDSADFEEIGKAMRVGLESFSSQDVEFAVSPEQRTFPVPAIPRGINHVPKTLLNSHINPRTSKGFRVSVRTRGIARGHGDCRTGANRSLCRRMRRISACRLAQAACIHPWVRR
jgi:hypothetical protein